MNPILENLDDYINAAAAWNNIKAGITFKNVKTETRARAADVVIIGYSDPYYSYTSYFNIFIDEDDTFCGKSVACTRNIGAYVPGFTIPIKYPVMGYQTFNIEERPRWGLNDPEDWTLDFSKSIDFPGKYEYLPSILMHEFGHTFGLGHGATVVNDVINGGSREIEPCGGTHADCGLSTIDKNAAKSLYQP